MVIGTFAYCGSGQDTLADGFCHYKGFCKYSLGDVIREIAAERELPQKREVLQQIREECDRKYGRFFIPEKMKDKIDRNSEKDVILTGIRTVEEYEYFRDRCNMILLFVYAEEEIRFQRMLKRADEKDETNKQSLKKRMEKEEALFDYKQLEQYADARYDFNESLEEYRIKEEQVIDRLYDQLESMLRTKEEG